METLFSSLTYVITGGIDQYHETRLIITNNIMGRLVQVCDKFIKHKYPKTVINYRSTKNICKSNMQRDNTWGSGLELFAAALFFRTDIWVFTSDIGNKWTIYFGKRCKFRTCDHITTCK